MTNPPRGRIRSLHAAIALLLAQWMHAPLRAQETRTAAEAAPAAEKRPLLTNRHRSERLPIQAAPPPPVEAGVIARAELTAVLASGIGRFLQQVRAEPALASGRFVGWRLVSLFSGSGDIQVRALRPGDLVTRVNGQSIERPEQFMKLWESLADANELVLDIQRDGKPSRVRYVIQG